MAIRPKTLFASLAPVILGLTSATMFNHQNLDLNIAFITMLCALILQIASNLANDYLDALKGVDNEKRLGPTRVTSQGLIPQHHMRYALIFTLFLAFVLGTYLMFAGGVPIMIVGFLSLYFAYGYTGGPFPLSYNGLGEVAAFIFFGVVAVNGTYYLQTHLLNLNVVFLSIGPGAISACILAINNLRDIKSDSASHKKTIAVRFGERFQRTLCLALIFISIVVVILSAISLQFKWLLIPTILPFFFIKTWLQIYQGPIDSNLNNALQKTAIYNLFYCLFLSMGIYLSMKYY